jgi:hypothetical protein
MVASKRTSAAAIVGLVAWACVHLLSRPAAAPLTGIPDESLAARFDSDMRNVVFRWSEADPRSRLEQQRALFDFVYQTYDSSAWIPQSLFERNLITQTVAGDVDTIVRDTVGLVLWRDNPRVVAFGMAPSRSPDEPLGWTVNCLVCHTAEIDGVTYLGAGTKVFDDLVLGEALKLLTREAGGTGAAAKSIDQVHIARAQRILTTHHHDKIDSLTRARSTAFAASHVELYMRPHDGAMPAVSEVGRGDTKTPPLWHTAAKLPRGRWYSDGSFHGRIPLMASSMELEKDRSFDSLVDVVIPRIKSEFDAVVQHLRPPPYPYEIDRALAERGRQLFYSKSVGCARCHGVYDGRGNVDWPGVHKDIGTDPARREIVSDGFRAAFASSPLASEGALVKSEGYAATPLTGVWANYPYLHNGSVPTLYHLLGPVSERPKIFYVWAARHLDREKVGQPLYPARMYGLLPESGLLRRYGNDRDWFNTERPGSSNAGHDVWWRIGSDENRRALIEYLKTL